MNLNIERTAFVKASNVEIPSTFFNRLKTGIEEIDAMFGEGIIPGTSFTVTGRSGSGKSSLLLQIMEGLENNGFNVGYASGEENQQQLAYTCKRLNVKNVSIASETDVDSLAAATEQFDALVVDSFQALTSEGKGFNQSEHERYAISTLVKAAKENECALFIVMHHTKNGVLKGSTLIPHTVDVNIQIELDEDSGPTARVINFLKNRFGPALEYDARMTGQGFEFSGKREVVTAPSKSERKHILSIEILKLDPPLITKSSIMERFQLSSSQAYLVLKELCERKKLVKIGRGDNACYKKVNIAATVP